jgi:hypothetical protein
LSTLSLLHGNAGNGWRGVCNRKKSTALVTRNGKSKIRRMKNGCWVWRGSRDKAGYGTNADSADNPEHLAHRAVWFLLRGQIPEGMTVDHLCRNRGCVNPEHMELVTLKENVRRAPRTKLTLEQVKEIKSSPESLGSLARRFEVSKQAVYRVRKGLSWL